MACSKQHLPSMLAEVKCEGTKWTFLYAILIFYCIQFTVIALYRVLFNCILFYSIPLYRVITRISINWKFMLLILKLIGSQFQDLP